MSEIQKEIKLPHEKNLLSRNAPNAYRMAGSGRNVMTDSRMLLGKQPARTLLVDVKHSSAAQPQIVENLTEALENLFSVSCTFGGPSRIPLFSLISLTSYPEILLPLSHVKNNYPRIQAAIQDLKGTFYDSAQVQIQPNRGIITKGLQEACGQFRRQIQTGGFCHQLEVIIITCQSGNVIQKQIEEVSSSLDLENLKRIQVVSLCSGQDFSPWEDLDQNSSQNSLMSTTSNSSTISAGLTDLITLDTDTLSLQNFLNTWLLDNGTDSEHLHIILPSVAQGISPNMTVKCDLNDRILNPAQLPFHSHYTVHPDSATMKTFPTTSKALGIAIPVHKINIISLIPVGNLCDSVVFGMPMVAQATSCWKIDWDELEKNQQNFKALCQTLIDKDMALIGQLENSSSKKPSNKDQTELKPQGIFVFLAAPNGSLLVKSVAVQELLLPCQAGSGLEGIAEDALSKVKTSLDQLEVLETYNPLQWSSNLYECLKSKQKKNDPIKQKRAISRNKSQGMYGVPVEVPSTLKLSNFTSPSCSQSQQVVYPRSAKRMKERPVLPFPTDL